MITKNRFSLRPSSGSLRLVVVVRHESAQMRSVPCIRSAEVWIYVPAKTTVLECHRPTSMSFFLYLGTEDLSVHVGRQPSIVRSDVRSCLCGCRICGEYGVYRHVMSDVQPRVGFDIPSWLSVINHLLNMRGLLHTIVEPIVDLGPTDLGRTWQSQTLVELERAVQWSKGVKYLSSLHVRE